MKFTKESLDKLADNPDSGVTGISGNYEVEFRVSVYLNPGEGQSAIEDKIASVKTSMEETMRTTLMGFLASGN